MSSFTERNLKNFIATAQAAHLLLPQQHGPGKKQKGRSLTLYSASQKN
jgi:hypothetical protein